MDIGELNRRITLKSWTQSQDLGGGNQSTVNASYTVWAKVEDRQGSQVNAHNAIDFVYDYKVTFRYDPNRVVDSSFTIDYEDKQLAIKNLSYDNEAHKHWCIARCSLLSL